MDAEFNRIFATAIGEIDKAKFERAGLEVDSALRRKVAKAEADEQLWTAQSERRRISECPMLDNVNGRIHETHIEIPVVYGYHASGELVYVSFGGHDIMEYMSPGNLDGAQREVAFLAAEEEEND